MIFGFFVQYDAPKQRENSIRAEKKLEHFLEHFEIILDAFHSENLFFWKYFFFSNLDSVFYSTMLRNNAAIQFELKKKLEKLKKKLFWNILKLYWNLFIVEINFFELKKFLSSTIYLLKIPVIKNVSIFCETWKNFFFLQSNSTKNELRHSGITHWSV